MPRSSYSIVLSEHVTNTQHKNTTMAKRNKNNKSFSGGFEKFTAKRGFKGEYDGEQELMRSQRRTLEKSGKARRSARSENWRKGLGNVDDVEFLDLNDSLV